MRSFLRSRISLVLVAIVCVGSAGTSPARAGDVQSVLYVRADAAAGSDGTSWADAYTDLQAALVVAESGSDIWVAAGTYTPGGPGDRTATFQLRTGVGIYGGFAGTEVSRSERSPATNLTVLSGDLSGNDLEVLEPAKLVSESTRSDNSYHVVTGSGADQTAVLDGFVITGGNANGAGSGNFNGGGLINVSSGGGSVPANPTLVNCTFQGNSASRNGGGVYNEAGIPTFIDCVFGENHANGGPIEQGGGGMYNERGSLTLRHCRFVGNTTNSDGAGLYNMRASPIIIDTACDGYVVARFGHVNNGGGVLNYFSNATMIKCTFSGNSASFGGGIWNWGPPSPILFNCIFSRNEAGNPGDGAGGGLQNWGGNPSVINCTFSENTAVSVGGGLCEADGSRTTVTSCIFWGNRARDRTDANGQMGGGSTVVTYSCVQGGRSGEGNIDTDPHFADPENGNYRLKSQAGRWDPLSESWTQDEVTSQCIDAGDPMSAIGPEFFPNGGFVNMGAYGGTVEASKSYFGEPICGTIVAGDINGDCQVNRTDLEIMALHWTGEEPLLP
jgi:hypothetical protein